MASVNLRVLPHLEAAAKTLIDYRGKGPAFLGKGPDDYVCGKCGNVIFKAATPNRDIVKAMKAAFKCNQCGAVNGLS